jgi:hypothetical protein
MRLVLKWTRLQPCRCFNITAPKTWGRKSKNAERGRYDDVLSVLCDLLFKSFFESSCYYDDFRGLFFSKPVLRSVQQAHYIGAMTPDRQGRHEHGKGDQQRKVGFGLSDNQGNCYRQSDD